MVHPHISHIQNGPKQLFSRTQELFIEILIKIIISWRKLAVSKYEPHFICLHDKTLIIWVSKDFLLVSKDFLLVSNEFLLVSKDFLFSIEKVSFSVEKLF